MADGFIAGWNAKFYFNFWRPVTAIRAADTDGNDNTVSDMNWNTYLNTPAIPDYPSTHSVLGGAASEVLSRFFGSDAVAFTVTSGAPLAGITRSFQSLSQAAQENADSRCMRDTSAGVPTASSRDGGLGVQFTHYLGHPVDVAAMRLDFSRSVLTARTGEVWRLNSPR
jgi:hypothetical protein